MKYLFLSILVLLAFLTMAQQINIPRVDEMPDFPQPYHMRDWKDLAYKYDSLVFNLEASGQYLPLASLFDNTINYPEHSGLAIQSYVGTNSPPGKEAINILPAVVGATLVGIDKSNQYGKNWPLYCEEYFNRTPEENVYLNGPVSSSGNDWWYETMPNIFFYQLNYFYPFTGSYGYQVITLADRWLEAVYAMDGSTTPWQKAYMNYRAFKLSTMTPKESGVKEPEAAGAIGWILYQAYNITLDDKYLVGAELCLEFLSEWEQNPSYEIQLPYGVYAAARMNAEIGTQYDIDKMINWCFDKGDLRGWGVITGNWGGVDMDGLIGEVNASQPDYVFHMNSLEHVGALVPMTRYDDRYATAIGKWVLNAANASRFYYSDFLADDMQDNEDWVTDYDPNSAIAYESLREKDNGPYGTGDAMGGGWAETNLGLYGSSHVGIFGGIIETTNVEGVLKLDLLATDYYKSQAYPTFLYYNPKSESVQVEINLLAQNHDVYDAISNQLIQVNATGVFLMDIAAKASVMPVLLPSNSVISYELNKAYVEGIVIDYNVGQSVSNYPPRIKALAADDTVGQAGYEMNIYCSADDKESPELEYQWTVDGGPQTTNEDVFSFLPVNIGFYQIACTVVDGGGLVDSKTLLLEVVEKINILPVINQLTAEDQILAPNGMTNINCMASDADDDELSYQWFAASGTITGTGADITYTAPSTEANIYIVCEVTDIFQASDKDSILILSRDPGNAQSGDLVAHYLFANNADDETVNANHGSIWNCLFTEDMSGTPNQAIKLNASNSKVIVANNEGLNFQDGLSVSYWIKIDELFEWESYPVSHGNWTTRWKTSITNDHLRFTVNGSEGIMDTDSKSILETDTWYHIVGVYNGSDQLVFINGVLEGYAPFSGTINTTPYDLVIGQSLPDQTGFNYKGLMDNLRIYNYGISYEDVKEIYSDEKLGIIDSPLTEYIQIYPNPLKTSTTFTWTQSQSEKTTLTIFNVSGQRVKSLVNESCQNGEHVIVWDGTNDEGSDVKSGMYFYQLRVGKYLVSARLIVIR